MGDSESSNSVDNSTIPTTPERSPSCSPSSDNDIPDDLDQDSCSTNKASLPVVDDANVDIRPNPVRSICFVGAGYVGGPTAALMAFNNPHIRVTVVDKDDRRIRRWNSRHLPIYEPGLAEVVRIARDGLRESTKMKDSNTAATMCFRNQDTETPSIDGDDKNTELSSPRSPNLFFSTDVSRSISESEIVVIAVNTPTKMRGAGKGSATDMTSFEAVATEVVRHARSGTIIVEKSTVPCRTAEMIQEMVRV